MNVRCFTFVGKSNLFRIQLLMEKLDKKSKTPIINAVYQVLYKNKSPKKVFEKLTEKLD